MFGFIMPGCGSLLIVALFLRKRQVSRLLESRSDILIAYGRKLKASDPSEKKEPLTVLQQFYVFVIAIDLGGILLLSGGAALILVPCSLAAS
jgi:hypothetical protein